MVNSGQNNTGEKAEAISGPLFLISGTDEFEVSRNARHLVDALCPPSEQTLGLEVIEGAVDTIDEAVTAVRKCLDALCTVGFFGTSKVVWLRDASFFNEGKPGKFDDVKAAVLGLTEEIKRGFMPGVRLVISAASVDKRTGFYKSVEKSGKVAFHNLPDKNYKWDEHAAGVVQGMLSQVGLRARSDVIRIMVERAGNQSRQLSMEVEKLSLYMKDRVEVTEADVLDIVSPARERGFGEFTDAFGRKDLPGSLKIARQLVHQKESPVGLIIALENRVRDLLTYRTALHRRWARLTGSDDWPKLEWSSGGEAESYFSSLANDPRKANPFWAGILAKQSAKFSMEELQRIQLYLVEEHGKMTGGIAPAEILLEWVLMKTLGVSRDQKN